MISAPLNWLVEAAQVTVRSDPQRGSQFCHLAMRQVDEASKDTYQ